MLDEIAKLKRGEFSDDLLPSVVNNMKRDFYKQLESNQFRANAYVDAFINRHGIGSRPWARSTASPR